MFGSCYEANALRTEMAAARSERWGKLLHKYIYGGPLWVWHIKIKSVGMAQAHILIRHNCELITGPCYHSIYRRDSQHHPSASANSCFLSLNTVSETLGECLSTWFLTRPPGDSDTYSSFSWSAIFLGPSLHYQLSIITKITRLLYLCLPNFLSIFNKAANGLMAWNVDGFRYRQINDGPFLEWPPSLWESYTKKKKKWFLCIWRTKDMWPLVLYENHVFELCC